MTFDSEDLMMIPKEKTEYRNSFWLFFNLYERLYFIEVIIMFNVYKLLLNILFQRPFWSRTAFGFCGLPNVHQN